MPESLPPGVGQVPEWWMEITPHHKLDLEEDAARREREARMQLFFDQLAAAQDAGLVDAEGNLLLDGSGTDKDYTINSKWQGRQAKDGNNNNNSNNSPTGRNFTIRLDPTKWGISESDPDFYAYQSGAKLPPAFLAMLQKYKNGDQDWSLQPAGENNFLKYGEEKQQFKPAWMKTKLRSTNAGQLIRKGVYYDNVSPARPTRRIMAADSSDDNENNNNNINSLASPNLEQDYNHQDEEYNNEDYDDDDNNNEPRQLTYNEDTQPSNELTSYDPNTGVTTTRGFAKTRTVTTQASEQAPATVTKSYYAQEVTTDAQGHEHVQEVFYNNNNNLLTNDHEEYNEDEYYDENGEEEYYDDENGEEYYDEDEEYYDDDQQQQGDAGAGVGSLTDLQAILAAKQAELRRLQGL